MRVLKRLTQGVGLLATVSVLSTALVFATVSVSAAQEADSQQSFGKKKRNNAPTKIISNSGAAANGIIGKAVTQTEILNAKNISPMLAPDSASAMQAAADRYMQIVSNGGFPKVSKGSYKKGSQGPNVESLNRRLFMDGYVQQAAAEGEFATIVTSATVDGLSRFQQNMGLAVTGKMDPQTLAELNVPAADRLRTIQANVARLQAYAENLGDRYLVVNVPSQQIETVSGGRVFSRHNAIVGRVERPTPVVMTALSDVNFNPYWNAPASIVEKDLIPKMKSGTQILRDMNIKVFQGFGGPEIDPDTVDWSSVNPDDYHFRQEPGPASAMATAKINFPSPFGIYLHDTPDKHLFSSGQRFYSSGCVRVEKMGLLLEWVLNGQDGIGGAEINALAETLERRDVKLASPPQLRVAYLTAWPVGNSVAFRKDIYGLDGTGFVSGQPLPEGELSAEGQRFVLKPVPRKAGAVDEAEAESFSLFGSHKGKKPASTPAIVDDGDISSTPQAENKAVPKKLPFQKKLSESQSAGNVKPANTKKFGAGKSDAPGLFDWAAYRKQQKQGGKVKAATADAPVKKKVISKTASKEVAAATPKLDEAAAKKTPVDPKLAKKPVAAEGKAVEKAPVEQVAKATPKTEAATPVKPVLKDAKKPAAKVEPACKPDAAGVLPKGCKAPTATATKKLAPATTAKPAAPAPKKAADATPQKPAAAAN